MMGISSGTATIIAYAIVTAYGVLVGLVGYILFDIARDVYRKRRSIKDYLEWRQKNGGR